MPKCGLERCPGLEHGQERSAGFKGLGRGNKRHAAQATSGSLWLSFLNFGDEGADFGRTDGDNRLKAVHTRKISKSYMETTVRAPKTDKRAQSYGISKF